MDKKIYFIKPFHHVEWNKIKIESKQCVVKMKRFRQKTKLTRNSCSWLNTVTQLCHILLAENPLGENFSQMMQALFNPSHFIIEIFFLNETENNYEFLQMRKLIHDVHNL